MEEQHREDRGQLTGLSQELTITFELLTAEGEHDPALLQAVGDATTAALQPAGYTVQPATYTGERGIESFLVDLVTIAQQVAATVWANHAAISEGIADLSGLVTIFTTILPIVRKTRQVHEQQVGKDESAVRPLKMTVEIDGGSLIIETDDLVQADAALQLALKYCSAHPEQAARVTTKSRVKVQARIPARKRRPRR